ncbi:MAG: hypothetical protein J7K62_02120, partial [Thermoplasmata archaeon]|nr:hypothetical protein [Thermoplasmata archaeon]
FNHLINPAKSMLFHSMLIFFRRDSCFIAFLVGLIIYVLIFFLSFFDDIAVLLQRLFSPCFSLRSIRSHLKTA